MNREQITNHYLETRGCRIKRTYMKKSDAKAIARKMNIKTQSGRIRAYSCAYCDGYHVGHIRPSFEDRIESKRIEKVLKHAI